MPGIRSDRGWAYVFAHKAKSPTARIIITEIISGPGDLGVTDLVFRHRMGAFRLDYSKQIQDAIQKHTLEFGKLDVFFICHSMGSSIFSEIFGDLFEFFNRDGRVEKKYVVFLGSVARRTAGTRIGKSCNRFINDVGLGDFWPLAASVLNPFKYDHVGRFGFGRALVLDRFFNNNHSTCTEIKHLEDWILPIVEDGIIKEPVYRNKKTRFNFYRHMKKLVWLSFIIIFVGLIFAIFYRF